MSADNKNLTLPGKEDKRAAALRENLKRRKVQAAEKKSKDKDDGPSETNTR